MPLKPLQGAWWRRIRVSLRGLMILVLAVGGGLGWFAHLMRQGRIQRNAIAAVRKLGGSALYDWQFEGKAFRLQKGTNLIVTDVPGWPKWLVDRLGVDVFGSVASVSFRLSPTTPSADLVSEALAHVGHLSRLKTLSLGSMPVTDAGLCIWTNYRIWNR